MTAVEVWRHEKQPQAVPNKGKAAQSTKDLSSAVSTRG